MRRLLMGLIGLGLMAAGSVQAAPFAPASVHKGRSVLVYDTSTVDRDGPYMRAWVYLIVRQPMDGATMVAYRREFVCGVDQSRDVARRFVSPTGETLRAVETPGEWQTLEPGTDDYAVLEKVCGRAKTGPVAGKGMTVFDYHDAVQTALSAAAMSMETASR